MWENVNNLSPKIGSLRMVLKAQNGDPLENNPNGPAIIQQVYGDNPPKWNCTSLGNSWLAHNRAPMLNIRFVEASWTDCIFE
jgi:hypothetical protein